MSSTAPVGNAIILPQRRACLQAGIAVLVAGLIRTSLGEIDPPTDLVSRPAGFLRHNIPAGSNRHFSMPFEPFTPGIDAQLSGQLTGTPDMVGADAVLRCLILGDTLLYQQAYKCDGTGDPARDGRWFEDFQNPIPATATIGCCESFWVFNVQIFDQTLLLAGEVPLADQAIAAMPGNFRDPYLPFGYPFAAALPLSEIRFDPLSPSCGGLLYLSESPRNCTTFLREFDEGSWQWRGQDGERNAIIPVGQGFGLAYWGDATVAWTYDRPYDAPFPTDADHLPCIVDIRSSPLTNGVDVSLRGTGNDGEILDIFWQDADRTNGFQALSWKLAASVQLSDANVHIWTDIGDADRLAPGYVPLRFYLLGRTDTDSDGDSLPDPRETYVYRSNPNNADSDGDEMPDGWEIEYGFNLLSATDALQDADNDGLSNVGEYFAGTHPQVPDTDGDGLKDGAEIDTYRLSIEPTAWVDLPEDAINLRAMIPGWEDDGAVAVTLPFGFAMQGITYTSAEIGVNGLIEFGNVADSYSPYRNQALPCEWIGPIVAAFWDDLYLHPVGSDVLYATVPSGMSTVFVVEWHDVVHLLNPDSTHLTFQAVLEPSGVVRINYRSLSGYLTDGESATLGVQGIAGCGATLFAFEQPATVHNGLSIVYSPVTSTNPLDPDCDDDGLDDGAELAAGTNPLVADSDHDGLLDAWEQQLGLNPVDPDDAAEDADGDGLSNLDEWERETNHNIADTDTDGLSDGEEVQKYGTDPLVADIDLDGLTDGEEVRTYGTNSLLADSDGDGLNDGEEVRIYGTYPLVADSDGDGLNDRTEVLPPDHENAPGAYICSYQITSGHTTGTVLDAAAPQVTLWQGGTVNGSGAIRLDGFASIPVGFGFPCGNTTWNSVYVSIHGVIGLGAAPTEYRNDVLPCGRLPPTSLLPFWDDLVMPAGGSVRYVLNNVPDGRHLAIEWRDFTRYDTPDTRLTFQALLYENGRIEYRYLRGDGPAADGYSALIGLQLGNPSYAACYSDCATGAVNAGLYVRFEPVRRYTSPLDADSDDDTFSDGWEIEHGLNPLMFDEEWSDADGDGICNIEESIFGTDLLSTDSDGDGLSDPFELYFFYSDPVAPDPVLAADDSDGDGLSNVEESAFGFYWSGDYWIFCNPFWTDSDSDGLNDGDEVHLYGTSPICHDTDRDGLPDGWEVLRGFDPFNPANGQADSDGDGLSNGLEVSYWGSSPFETDSDNDGIWDGVETSFYPLLHPMQNDLIADYDGDGASNLTELQAGTSGSVWDTDGDAASDGMELAHGLNPLDPNDGLRDADGDRVPNAFELAWGTDPNDAHSIPQTPFVANTAASLAPMIAAALAAPSNQCALVRLMPGVSYDSVKIMDANVALCVFAPAGSNARITCYSAGYQRWVCLEYRNRRPLAFAGITFDAGCGRNGIWVDGTAQTVFRDCCFTGGQLVDSALIQSMCGTGPVIFENSVFSGNSLSSYRCDWAALVALGRPRFNYCTITANTNYFPTGKWGAHLGEIVMDWSLPVPLRNSIVWNNPGFEIGDSVLFDASNLIDVNPRFEAGSWHLSWDSPGIGKGDDGSVSFDAEGCARAMPPNLGAFETAGTDRDNDRLPDAWETIYGMPTNLPSADLDLDGDGLTTLMEYRHRTNPAGVDTDSDDLSDNVEVNQMHTNPTCADTDGDGLPDGWEVFYGMNPRVDDARADLDADGLVNVWEYAWGTNPGRSDSDGDGLGDHWEATHGCNPVVPDANRNEDADGDGINTDNEFMAGTDPFSVDSDHDGVHDNVELAIGTSPLSADTDGDGLADGAELAGTAAYVVRRSPDCEWVAFSASSHWITNWMTPSFRFYFDGSQYINDAYTHPISFDIRVGTNTSHDVHISANGLIALGARFSGTKSPFESPSENPPLPVLSSMSALLAPYWDNLVVPMTNGVWWATNSINGAPRLLVTWESASWHRHPDYAIRIQAEYRADTHAFTFRYLATDDRHSFDNVAGATLGIQGIAGSPVARVSPELAAATRPGTSLHFLPAVTDPLRSDTDGDGISDGCEAQLGTDPTVADAAHSDQDNDGLSLAVEIAAGTSPLDPDSDGDGFSDAEELSLGMNPRVPCMPNGDDDRDGLSNWEEYCRQTNPIIPDTDYDGISDFMEDLQGSDPTDPADDGEAPPANEVADVRIELNCDEIDIRPPNIQVHLGRIRHRPYEGVLFYHATYRVRRGVALRVSLATTQPAAATGSGYVALTVDDQPFTWRVGSLLTAGSAILDDPELAFYWGWAVYCRRDPLPDATLTLPLLRIINADGPALTPAICGQTDLHLKAEVQPACSGSYAWSANPAGCLANPVNLPQSTVSIASSGNVTVTVTFTPQHCLDPISKTLTFTAHHRFCHVGLGIPAIVPLNNDNDCNASTPDLNWPMLSDAENDVPACGPTPPLFCCTAYASLCRVSVTREPGGPPVNLYQTGPLRKTPYVLPDNIPADQVRPFRIEGVQRSDAIGDVRYKLTLQRPSSPPEVSQAAATVLRVDLDADLNGDERIDGADPDDPVEGQSPGVILDMNAGRMPCLRMQAWLPGTPAYAKLRLSAYGAPVRLWDGEDRRTATCVLDTSDASPDNNTLLWNANQFAGLEPQPDSAASGRTYWIEGVQKGTAEFSLMYDGASVVVSDSVIASIVFIGLTPDFNRDGRIDEADRQSMARQELFRFWINDDRDVGDDATDAEDDSPLDSYLTPLREPVMSRSPNCRDYAVNGTRDLIDFFPVQLDLPLDLFPPQSYTYTVKQKDAAVNMVFTALAAEDVRAIHTRTMISGFGATGESGAAEAPSQPVTVSGVTLPTAWLTAGHNIIMLEGRERTSLPLVLEITQNGRLVCQRAMGLSVSPVREMFRCLNIRTCDSYFTRHTRRVATQGMWATSLNPPANYPDGYYNPPGETLKTFITVHGLDWDETETPAGNAELFKRFFQSGLNARFIGVSWASDLSRRLGAPIIYGHDVIGAFVAARHVKLRLAEFLGPDTSVFAHSLGNVLVSSAIQDYGLQIGKYFMLNAAVPVEAYDGRHASMEERMKMVPPKWKNPGSPPSPLFNEGLMCASWSRLFEDAHDPRSALTWDGRFKKVTAMPSMEVYQFYSTGEEVLREPDGLLPNFLDSSDFWPSKSSDSLGGALERVWVYHEMTKGMEEVFPSRLIPGHSEGGWGFNLEYNINLLNGQYWVDMQPSPVFIAKPFFKRFSTESDENIAGWANSIEWLYRPAGDPVVADKLPQGSFANQTIAKIKNHAKIMAESMPPLSGPAGSSALATISSSTPERCHNINDPPFKCLTLWPTARPTKSANQIEYRRWLHGDYKDVAYLYVHGLYDKIVAETK